MTRQTADQEVLQMQMNKNPRQLRPLVQKIIDMAPQLDGLDCHAVAKRLGLGNNYMTVAASMARAAEWSDTVTYEVEQDDGRRILRYEPPIPVVEPIRSMGRPYPGGSEL